MSPGYDLWPSVSSVVPVFTLARTNASIEAAELSGKVFKKLWYSPEQELRLLLLNETKILAPLGATTDSKGRRFIRYETV